MGEEVPEVPVSVMDDMIDALSTALTTATGDMFDILGTVLPIVIPVGLAIVAVTVGWKFAKRFVRG